MGQIGRFIDRCVAREPELMQRVLDRPWGTLAQFIDFDEAGEQCGCLVGSIGIESGSVCSPAGKACDAMWEAIAGAANVSQCQRSYVRDIGDAVYLDLAARVAGIDFHTRPRYVNSGSKDHHIGDDAELRTIAMLKARIARRLAELREAAALALAEVAR